MICFEGCQISDCDFRHAADRARGGLNKYVERTYTVVVQLPKNTVYGCLLTLMRSLM